MNNKDIRAVRGFTNILPERKRYDTLNWYPTPWVELHFLSEEEKQERDAQEEYARRERLARMAWQAIHPPTQVPRCKRCKKEIQARFTYCYRCNNYMKVKARIAS